MRSILFTKIPKELILDNDIGEKRLQVFMYLNYRSTLDGSIAFCVNDVVEFCGFKIDTHKNKINDTYKDILKTFANKEYIIMNQSKIKKISNANYSICKANNDLIYPEEHYAVINDMEYQKIKDYKKKHPRANIDGVLLVLAYIRLYMFKRNFVDTKESEIKEKPAVCFRFYKTIAQDIGLNERSVASYIKILENLNIIHQYKPKKYKDGEGKIRSRYIIFADTYKYDKYGKLAKGYDYLKEIRCGEELLKNGFK